MSINFTQSIPQLTQALRNNALDPIDYINYLEGINNQLELKIHSFVTDDNRYERLRREAQDLVVRFPEKHKRPPLFCLPIGVKDIFNVDRFQTQAGSRLPSSCFKGKEATCVSQLKALGCLVLGKTVTTEFAYFAPGPTRNPHNLDHTPGGSSSGSAAAVSAGLTPFALGTQTIGSVIRPASYCGVVGFKPTYDRISKDGVLPLAPSVDTIGSFTADVVSAKFMAQLIFSDWQSTDPINHKPVFGVPRGPYLNEATPEMGVHFEKTVSLIAKSGFQIKEVNVFHDFEEIKQRHNLIVAVEAYNTHKKLYEDFHSLYHPKTIHLLMTGKEANINEYQSALGSRSKLKSTLKKKMELGGIDLWLSPPAKDSAPYGIQSTGDPVMNLPWTYCGFPVINIPSGENASNLPLGIQVAGYWGKDEILLNWGVEIEKLLSG